MSPKGALIWLCASSAVLGIVAFGGTFVAAFAVMMFDAPGSENNPATIALFTSLCGLPIVSGTTVVFSWILYVSQRYRAACAITIVLPLLNALAIAAALAYISIVQDGKFAP